MAYTQHLISTCSDFNMRIQGLSEESLTKVANVVKNMYALDDSEWCANVVAVVSLLRGQIVDSETNALITIKTCYDYPDQPVTDSELSQLTQFHYEYARAMYNSICSSNDDPCPLVN